MVGYHLLFWKTGDLEYCAVSDTARDELLGLARLTGLECPRRQSSSRAPAPACLAACAPL